MRHFNSDHTLTPKTPIVERDMWKFSVDNLTLIKRETLLIAFSSSLLNGPVQMNLCKV